MLNQIAYLDDARQDIKEARTWYKKQQKGLSKRFSASVKEAIIRIQLYPEVYAIRYRNIKIVHTNIFPFSIYFYTQSDRIIIIAVVHNHRDFQTISERVSF